MTESILISYEPIVSVHIIHKKSFDVTFEELIGIILTSSQISSPDKITIQRQNGDIVDIIGAQQLPYVINPKITRLHSPGTLDNEHYDYICSLGTLNVQFNTLEFIRGVASLCKLLGINPSGLITNPRYKGQNIKLKFEHYIGKITLAGEEQIISISKVKPLIGVQYESLVKSLDECFHYGENTGVWIPSVIYIDTTDEQYVNIIATATATTNLSVLPEKYRNIEKTRYISSVCAGNAYRGQGITKSVMISLLNDLIREGVTSFLLEVEPDNIPAYKLYSGLGFVKIDDTFDFKHYHLLYLKI